MPWQLAAAGASGVLGLIGNAWQQRNNQKMMQQQMQYNTSEREASQAYQTSEREAQNAYQESMYNKYQSPQALVEQYKAAGLNPRLAVDGSGVGQVGAASNGGAPSGSSIAAPYQQIGSTTGAFQDIASALSAMAQAKKAGVETDRLKKFMDDELRGIQLSNEAQKLLNSVNEKYLDKQTAQLLKNAVQAFELGTISKEEMRSKIELLAKHNLIAQNEVDHWLETYKLSSALGEAELGVKNATVSNLESSTAHNLADINRIASDILSASVDRELKYNVMNLNDSITQLNVLEHEIRSETSESEKSSKRAEYRRIQSEADVQLLKLRSSLKHSDDNSTSGTVFNFIRECSKALQGK